MDTFSPMPWSMDQSTFQLTCAKRRDSFSYYSWVLELRLDQFCPIWYWDYCDKNLLENILSKSILTFLHEVIGQSSLLSLNNLYPSCCHSLPSLYFPDDLLSHFQVKKSPQSFRRRRKDDDHFSLLCIWYYFERPSIKMTMNWLLPSWWKCVYLSFIIKELIKTGDFFLPSLSSHSLFTEWIYSSSMDARNKYQKRIKKFPSSIRVQNNEEHDFPSFQPNDSFPNP